MDTAPTAEMPPPTAQVSEPCPVGEVMRRVQGQLRNGRAPSFEALLAFGAPADRPPLG
ncbi:MAG TPA: hypothetical protein VK906_10440 [Egicoccus sp.]|nr:hypothetical protein [Egicoccus sp.]HSK23586.1 hypothetical protein [Egicoccus sp.]